MLLVCLSGIAVLPEAQAIPLRNSPRRLPHHQQQRPNLARPNLPRPVPSSPPSPRQITPISRPLTPVSSGKTTTTAPIASERKNAPLRSAPTPAEKVEDFAKKLRDDMDKQERVLNVFIKTIKDKHANTQTKLSRVKVILKGLKDEINNATKYANQYQSQDNELTKQQNMYKTEYDKSYKMYLEEQANIKFEKQFLEEILRYIKLRKTQKC
jgi:septal ring factor EnvC (AmiA/AmiB activator)